MIQLVMAMVPNVACYSTYNLPTAALATLDGFREHDRRRIATSRGPIEFDRSTQLELVGAGDQVVGAGRFSSILVVDDSFVGTTTRGSDVIVDLGRVQSIRTKKLSPASTVGAALSITAGVIVFGLLVAAFAFAASSACITICGGF